MRALHWIGTAALGLALAAPASAAMTAAEYKQAQQKADADYKVAAERCKPLRGNEKDVCMNDAKAARDSAKAQARAEYKATPKARAEAKEDMAEAKYRAAKERCDALTGNEKDVCIQRAKADKEKAEADATKDRRVAEARTDAQKADARADAQNEKRDAEYRVAREKCDSLKGEAKDRCVEDAKARFGK
jgi:hypothetical protein